MQKVKLFLCYFVMHKFCRGKKRKDLGTTFPPPVLKVMNAQEKIVSLRLRKGIFFSLSLVSRGFRIKQSGSIFGKKKYKECDHSNCVTNESPPLYNQPTLYLLKIFLSRSFQWAANCGYETDSKPHCWFLGFHSVSPSVGRGLACFHPR